MNQEFKQCLESKKIIPFARGKKLAEKELSIAQGDLSDEKQVLRISDIMVNYTGLLCHVPCC